MAGQSVPAMFVLSNLKTGPVPERNIPDVFRRNFPASVELINSSSTNKAHGA